MDQPVTEILAEIRDLLAAREELPLLLTRVQAAALLGFSLSAFDRAVSAEEIPQPRTTPSGMRWHRGDLQKYADRLRVRRKGMRKVST